MLVVALNVVVILLDIALLVSLVRFLNMSQKIYEGMERVHDTEPALVTHAPIRLLLHDKDGREVRDVTIHADETPKTYHDGGRVYQLHEVIGANRIYREA